MTLRVALVGAGRIAQEAHLPAWSARPDAVIRAIIDSNRDAARASATKYGIGLWEGDLSSVIGDDQIDAVDICSPASTHAAIAIACMRAGKHVLIEKPVALTMKELDDVVRAAAETGLTAMVAENWMYSYAVHTTIQAVQSGRIGTVRVLEAVHESPFWIDRSGQPSADADNLGYMTAAGAHTLHVARKLVGDLEELCAFSTDRAQLTPLKGDREMAMSGRSQAGALVSIVCAGQSLHLGERRLWFRLIGSRGVAEFDVWGGWSEITSAGELVRYRREPADRGFEGEIAEFVRAISEHSPPATDVRDYRYTLGTLLAVYSSAMSGELVQVRRHMRG